MALRMQVDNPVEDKAEREASVSIDGTVDWIKFPKPGSKPPENGFAVLVVRTGDGRQHDVNRTLHNPAVGIEVPCEGVWAEYRGRGQLQADLIEVKTQASDRGHTAMPRKAVLDDAAKLLEVSDRDKLAAALDALAEDDSGLVSVDLDGAEHYCLPKHYHSKRRIAQELARIAGGGPPLMDGVDEGVFAPYRLHPAQESGVRMALTNKVSVLTGAPGTGKTTILKAILDLARHGEATVRLYAPTGRAANRMEASTGHEAKTVHRLLRWDPRAARFLHDAKNPLKTDFVIMDESSMADAWLASRC